MQDSVGSMGRFSDSGSEDAFGPEIIQCVDGQEPQIHEVWDFVSDGITREIHPTAQMDVGSEFYFISVIIVSS